MACSASFERLDFPRQQQNFIAKVWCRTFVVYIHEHPDKISCHLRRAFQCQPWRSYGWRLYGQTDHRTTVCNFACCQYYCSRFHVNQSPKHAIIKFFRCTPCFVSFVPVIKYGYFFYRSKIMYFNYKLE